MSIIGVNQQEKEKGNVKRVSKKADNDKDKRKQYLRKRFLYIERLIKHRRSKRRDGVRGKQNN